MRSLNAILVVAVSGLWLTGCTTRPPPASTPQLPAHRIAASQWRMSSSGDAENVALAVQPNGALQITLTGKSTLSAKGAVLTVPVDGWWLAPKSELRVTASCPDGDTKAAAAVRTDQYYESPPFTIPAQASEFSIDLTTNIFKSARSRWKHTDRIYAGESVKDIELILYPAAGETHRIVVPRVELADVTVPGAALPRVFRELSLEQVATLTTNVPRFGKLEIAARVSTAYMNPFDPEEVTLDATFVSPSGRNVVCPGFFYAYPARFGGPDEWRVRFSPDEPGTWTYTVKVTTPVKTVESEPQAVLCVVSPAAGPIRVSRRDAQYFEHADWSFFYPIGHNVCWNSLREYREQFGLMHRNGENWARVWIAPWNNEIEWSPNIAAYKGLGVYSLGNAGQLDGIVEAAERNDLYLQLVLHEHCRLSAKTNPEWQNNPYSRALGGPCATPQDFFTSDKARRLAKNRIRYIVARWGYSAHVMAWELFNEVDLTDDYRTDTDTAWHREMAEFIKSTDPQKHLVTTSYLREPNRDTYALPAIDYAQSHTYTTDIVARLVSLNAEFRTLHKPYFIGEFGSDTADGIDAKDRDGRFLHCGIWAQSMLPAAGGAMSWWWYDLIHPNGLYYHFLALRRFMGGLDRRTGDWESQTGRLTGERGAEANVMALVSSDDLLIWASAPAGGFRSSLSITNVADGAWRSEQWNTYKGKIVRTNEFVAKNGVLTLPIEFATADAAFQIVGPESPADRPKLLLNPTEPVEVPKTTKSV